MINPLKFRKKIGRIAIAVSALALSACAGQTNVVSKVINSPLSAAGAVQGAHTGINVHLQTTDAQGIEYFDPKVAGYGIPAGGRIEIEMGEGFVRDEFIDLTQAAIMLVSGAPQQGLPGKAVGYTIEEGDNVRTFVIKAKSPKGLPAAKIMPPAPGSKMDAMRNRGIKVFHIGFLKSAFLNADKAKNAKLTVRFIDGKNQVIAEGSGTLPLTAQPVPQILPNNFPDKVRNHNWQHIKPGQILGQTKGTVPLTLMLYDKANVPAKQMVKFKKGITGAGVLSTPQLNAMGYQKPAAIARYNGGLILRDTDGDGKLDPKSDAIIGGVIAAAPAGAKGQELRSLEKAGKLVLSRPATAYAKGPGKRFGGAIMALQFTGGSKVGKYRPTLALLRKPNDLKSGDGSSYTFTVVVE